jgi:hypothetical protein
MVGLTNASPLSVTGYPTAWKVKVVDDEIHRGFEYVRWEYDSTCRTGTLTYAAC